MRVASVWTGGEGQPRGALQALWQPLEPRAGCQAGWECRCGWSSTLGSEPSSWPQPCNWPVLAGPSPPRAPCWTTGQLPCLPRASSSHTHTPPARALAGVKMLSWGWPSFQGAAGGGAPPPAGAEGQPRPASRGSSGGARCPPHPVLSFLTCSWPGGGEKRGGLLARGSGQAEWV